MSLPLFATNKLPLLPALDQTGSKPFEVKTEPTTPIGNLAGAEAFLYEISPRVVTTALLSPAAINCHFVASVPGVTFKIV